MGLRINTNVLSLRAQNNLQKTNAKLNQSLTRLSTGLKINSAQDDAVGNSTSESLRAQTRGIDVALNNITSASSTFGVAEGYLKELTDLAQTMRSVAVQAADATVSSSGRNSLVDEFTSLQNEYNRLADDANFNGVRLLDGTFTSKGIQVGSNEGETISVSIGDARSSTIGKVAIFTAVATNVASTNATASTAFGAPGAGTTFTVGSSTTTVSSASYTSDGVSFQGGSDSAIAYVNAINEFTGESGVRATVLTNVVTIDYSTGDELDTNQNIVLNGVTVKDDGVDFSANNDTDASNLVSLINDNSIETGVTAEIDATNNVIKLKATDGRNIHIQVSARGATNCAFNVFGMTGSSNNTQRNYRGTFKLESDTAFTLGATASTIASATSTSVTIDSNTSLSNANLASVSNASSAISILDNVISQIQDRRAGVGQALTRFEIASSELRSRQENLSAANSAIKDADIAKETAALTQNQILQQAGLTVLAQANSAPNSALQLLQGL